METHWQETFHYIQFIYEKEPYVRQWKAKIDL